jgi:hypothetical protein
MWHSQASAQISQTKEYIRAGERLIAVLEMPPPYFTDVSGQQATEANLLHSEGIASGTTGCGGSPPTYCPTETLARDQMAVLVIASVYVAALGPGQGGNFTYNATRYFADVPTTYWAFKFIQKMYELGITAGCSTNPLDYCPSSTTLDYQMAVFSVGARMCAEYGPANGCASHSFTYPATPQYYVDMPNGSAGFAQVQYLTSLAVISPTPPNCGQSCYFYPNISITRGSSTPYLTRGILDVFSY